MSMIADFYPDVNPYAEYIPYSEAAWFRDVKSQNTAGGTSSTGTWNDRVLNTSVITTPTWASLSSNQFTLQAGTYDIFYEAPAKGCDAFTNRIYNITDSTAVDTTPSGVVSPSLAVSYCIMGQFVITISSAKTFKLQTYTQTGRATDGLGTALNLLAETYSTVFIRKIS